MKTILLVEDDVIIAMTQRMILEKNGFTVLTASSGEEAVKVAGRNPGIDLVLMDIDLGKGIDGTVAAQQILSSRELPVVFLSSHTEPEIVEKTGKITSYGYVVKNSGDTVLMTSIRMAFRLFDAKQEAAKHEKKLSDTMDHLKEAQEIALLGRWDYYHKEDRLQWSDTIYTMFNIDRSSQDLSLQEFLHAVHPDDREMVSCAWEESLENQKPYTIEHRVLPRGASTKWVLEKCRTLFDTSGNPIHSIGIVQDITERKESAGALKASLEELKKSQKVANVGNWIWHIPDNRLEWSDQMYSIFGIEKEHFTGELDRVIERSIHPEDRAIVEASNSSVITSKSPIPVEYRIIRPDGSIRTVWAEAGELELDEAGKPKLLRGIVHDISERKTREERINALLREKELILKESHHRIKNHYFVVESLLREQAAESDSPEAAKILKDAASRISGMHLLYEKLLQSDDFKQISLCSYLHELAAGVMKAYSSGLVQCETAIEDLPLDIDMIFPLGAIAVELMTNSLKYAFPPEAPGEIFLSFQKDKESYRLIVSDNGKGLPEGYTSEAPQHFGLMLVAMMAKQLGGSFSMDSVPGKGTESRVTIPGGKSPFPG